MANTKGRKASFGSLRKLPSGRIQARYTGPDGLTHTAPVTFETKLDAESWLSTVRADLVRGLWQANGKARPMTFEDYATAWLAERTLKPRTRSHYRTLLTKHLLPTFGPFTLKAITPDVVRRWHAEMGTTRPTLRAHAYALLRSILGSATQDELIPVNPAHVRGAGNSKRVHRIKPATLPELEALVAAMPKRLQMMTLLAAWCGLRFGELAELRRSDVDAKNGVLRIRRAVVRVDGVTIVGTPKSDAGTRDVAVPAAPVARTQGAPQGTRTVRPRRAPLPSGIRGSAVVIGAVRQGTNRHQGGARFLQGAGCCWTPRSALARPTAYRRCLGRCYGRDTGGANGPPRTLHSLGGPAIPTRCRRT